MPKKLLKPKSRHLKRFNNLSKSKLKLSLKKKEKRPKKAKKKEKLVKIAKSLKMAPKRNLLIMMMPQNKRFHPRMLLNKMIKAMKPKLRKLSLRLSRRHKSQPHRTTLKIRKKTNKREVLTK